MTAHATSDTLHMCSLYNLLRGAEMHILVLET
jgi:hypothetical protein